MPNILVLCHANQFRSVLTEYALRDALRARLDSPAWTVESAGVWAEEGAPAVRGLPEWSGLPEMAAHRSRPVRASLLSAADLVLVMERGQKEALALEFPESQGKIYLLSEMSSRVAYDIPDPALGRENPARLIKEILGLVEKGLPKITALAEENARARGE